MDEALEIRRMLEHFKANLPPHDLGNWQVQAQPVPPPIQVEGEPLYPMSPYREWTRYRIEGWATCSRCGKRFSIPFSYGNAYAVNESSIESTAEAMKERVQRDADRDGPCWGDIPEVREIGSVAVLDSVT